MGMEATEAYRSTRERVTALLRAVGPDDADRRVPACPNWTVREVAAHLAGAADDVLAGRLDGVASDEWTAAQVDARAGRSLAEIVDEWDGLGPRVEELFGDGGVHPQMVFDEVTHEHDIRAALDQAGARDSSGVDVAFGFLCQNFPSALRHAGAPPLTFRSGGQDVELGEGQPAATLTATPFDLVRSCSGRRTLDQIGALDWGGVDPSPWFTVFTWGPFSLPPEPFEAPDAG